ncbi:hypothetical protein [Eubacterium coprostanoligenes]|uniref:hypothetical protein n=1 Tax=Eubacterium coprostanoligenes TaxID=290054 RepID=UPI002356E4FC|nr:hypothetical protein [Eubacterium coprostanoligenes]MCI6253807.1 DUF3450 domain-containing protein [Eubacterium coprostanoligenes]MDY5400024.1 hypothetical protein [Eubacterium coprostanoligenes]
MKKFIKKTIAGLIAGVMAISSMPFTALAGDSYNAKPATSFDAKTGTATVYWDQSSDKNCTGHYNNLLYFNSYSEGINGTPTADTGGNNCYTRAWYPTMVFLYDGVNDSYAPVMGTASKSDLAIQPRYLNYFVPMDNNDSNNLADSSNFYCDTWIGSNGGTLDYTWTLGQSHHGVRASISDSSSSVFGLTRNTFYPHSSKLHVRTTVSFEGNDGYSHAQKIWWFAGSYTSNGKAPASGDKNFAEARKTTYVVNYKPLYDTAKKVADQLKTFDETKYTVASVNAYYTAINAMYNFDPNSYFTNISEANVETKVNDCAQAIKKCVDDYFEAEGGLEELPQIEQSYIDSYNNALKEAEAKALNPDNRYTADSIDALKAEIASVKTARDSVKTNEELEALTKRLLTAISNLVQAKFNVVFVTVGLDSTAETEKFNDYIEYGETYNADAGANVKKWVVTTDNGNTSTVIDNFDQKASFVITKDAKIYAYLSGEDSSTTSSKVTFLGRHNQVVAIRYVAEGMTLDTTKVDAPSIPFYHFENWDVASVKGDGNEYTVKATYTCNQASSDFCTVHFGEWSKAYAYDSYVYLPNTVAGTKYALYSDEQCTKLLTVLDGVDFYAPKTSDIYVKAYEAEATASIAVTGSFAEKDVEAGKNYANFNCKFYLPAGAKAIEWGVQVKSPDGTKTANVKGEKLSERNEYNVRFGTSSSSVTSITGRAYLVYVQDGVKTTIYSPEFVTVNLNA